MSDGTKGLRAGGVENPDGLLGALRAAHAPTPENEPRADLEALDDVAWAARDLGMNDRADALRAAIAEIEKGRALRKALWEALGYDPNDWDKARVNDDMLCAEIARLREENEALRKDNELLRAVDTITEAARALRAAVDRFARHKTFSEEDPLFLACVKADAALARLDELDEVEGQKCAVCGRSAPLVDSECPDCRH